MYELIQVAENSYYIQSPAKIGLLKLNETDVYFIDSGSDKEAGRKARQILDANGWHLKAIFNTHSHADHIGGNKYLQAQTGCKIYAPGIECDFTKHPILESAFLYGGFPPADLQHKFLKAQESEAELLTQDSLPDGLEIIPLPGHSFDMVGFRSADDVVYLADCLCDKETLEKYRIGFLCDVGAYLNTLKTVKTMQAKLFVPAHAEMTDDISQLAQFNIDKVHEIADKITGLCAEPLCFERIMQKLFAEYRLTMTFEQNVLVGSTVKSYLSWLKAENRIDVLIEDNMLQWVRKQPHKQF